MILKTIEDKLGFIFMRYGTNKYEEKIMTLIDNVVKSAERDIRHKAAEIAINPNYSDDEKHNKIMNLKGINLKTNEETIHS